MKKGITLIELVVAMAIFIIVVTIAIGAFVSVSRMKMLTSSMKEAQQKVRIASEMITRLARQGDRVYVSEYGESVEIYYNSGTISQYGYRFSVSSSGALFLRECEGMPVRANHTYVFTSLGCKVSDLSDGKIKFSNSSKFEKTGTVPSRLKVSLYGEVTNVGNSPYYSEGFDLITSVILEGLK